MPQLKSVVLNMICLLGIQTMLCAQAPRPYYEKLSLLNHDTCDKLKLSGCDYKDPNVDWSCTLYLISKEIQEKLRYPGIALENGREGSLLIQITIDDQGKVLGAETLHHFGQNSDKELSRFYEKSNLLKFHFDELKCLEPGKYLELKIPVSLTVENKGYPHLWNWEQIFCERNPHFAIQEIKAKRLPRHSKKITPISEMWLYRFGLANFDSFDLSLEKPDGSFTTWEKMSSLKSKEFISLLENLVKGDQVHFTVYDLIDGERSTFKKSLVIK